jgi:septal ring factor EnvC (AmiA/AmiB activator)
VFVERGWIDESQLERLLAHQARTGPPPPDEPAEADVATPVMEQPAAVGLGDIRRDLDELLAEVERRASAVSERAARETELEERLAEAETLMRVRDAELAAAREEIERFQRQLAERDEHDAAIRAALERVTEQLSSRD